MHHRTRCCSPVQANSRVVAEMQALQAQPSPLVAAQARRAERAADTEKFEKLIDNLNVGTCVLVCVCTHCLCSGTDGGCAACDACVTEAMMEGCTACACSSRLPGKRSGR